MKKIITMAVAGLLLGCALVACGSNASAGTMPLNLKDDNGRVFQIHSALAFEQAPGSVKVTWANGTVQTYIDGSGRVLASALASTDLAGRFFQVPGRQMWVNTLFITEIVCYSGTQTAIGYPSAPALFINDNCATWAAIKAQAN